MWILVVVMLVENMTRTSGGIFTWIYTKAMMLPGIVIGLNDIWDIQSNLFEALEETENE